MQHETIRIPQADVLWDVARVAEAVARGHETTEQIGNYIGSKGPRQGLYYTQAARILGLVDEIDGGRRVALTSYGRSFIAYDRNSQRHALRRLMRQREPTRSVIEALRERGTIDQSGVAHVLQQIAPLADSTARRRAQTVISWLIAAGIAASRDGNVQYIPATAPMSGLLRSI